ncbi:hypothetical protein [Nocardia sp. NPDC057030]|uniref:hypothetical protein n=1 Tax=unclassified Nocardia TaxID=2637762 RepID=UPI003641073E
MAREVKVYLWRGFRPDDATGRNRQTDEVVAAFSVADVLRITGMSRSDWKHAAGSVTGNFREIAVAVGEPGVVFWTELGTGHRADATWHRAEPTPDTESEEPEMTLTRSTPVRHANDPHQKGVVCRFIDHKPVVAWEGDNKITVHDADELVLDLDRLKEYQRKPEPDFRADLTARIRAAADEVRRLAIAEADTADRDGILDMLAIGDPITVRQLSTTTYLEVPTPMVARLASLATLVDVAESYLTYRELKDAMRAPSAS